MDIGNIDNGVDLSLINTAEGKALYESLFANTGSRETISIRDWVSGWSAIVGGVNGIPTSRQFNTLQYISDLKSLLLYQAVVSLQQAGTTGIKIGPPQDLGNNMVLFETMKESNKVIKIRRKDSEGNEQEYDLAAVFKMAESRENIKSGDSLSVLFGKVMRYLNDLKFNSFSEADDPFVLMTEATYIPPNKRTKGCIYGLITDKMGVKILFFDRYITGSEEPRVENTLYGIESDEIDIKDLVLQEDNGTYVAIFSNVVYIEEGQNIERKPGMIYAVKK